jgi:hypothetical protein
MARRLDCAQRKLVRQAGQSRSYAAKHRAYHCSLLTIGGAADCTMTEHAVPDAAPSTWR